jgi:hypothetical protein
MLLYITQAFADLIFLLNYPVGTKVYVPKYVPRSKYNEVIGKTKAHLVRKDFCFLFNC